MIIRIKLRVVTKAREDKIIKEPSGAWRVRVVDAPTKGKANAKVCELLAEEFKTAKSNVTVVHGLTTRDKVVEIQM